jgi:hypothetical protein
MRKLPVGQVAARLQAAAVTAESARIDSEIGAGASPSSLRTTTRFRRDQRPPLWLLGDTLRILNMSVDWGESETVVRAQNDAIRYLDIEVDDALAIAEQVDV